jgi:hypothetical protein
MDSIKYRHGKKAVELVSGACRGADTLGERYAEEQHWVIHSHPPDYDKYPGRSAPLIRNEAMAEEADVLVAFWDGRSRGTRHMIGCAFRNNLEIHIFRY